MASRSNRELDSPDTPAGVSQTMREYRMALASLPGDLPTQQAALMALLTDINARLAAQASSLTSEALSASLQTIDRPVLRSLPTETPSQPPDRGAPTSSRQPGALELLATSPRVGQRVVGKLLLADAKRRGAR